MAEKAVPGMTEMTVADREVDRFERESDAVDALPYWERFVSTRGLAKVFDVFPRYVTRPSRRNRPRRAFTVVLRVRAGVSEAAVARAVQSFSSGHQMGG